MTVKSNTKSKLIKKKYIKKRYGQIVKQKDAQKKKRKQFSKTKQV